MRPVTLLSRLARPTESRIVLLVLDGVGDLRCPGQPQTALDRACLPHLDALAKDSSLGRLVPVARGVTPGSGPAHLALFGYDPTTDEADIGRGVLEALGLGLALDPHTVAARGNFATADANGNLVDRRAGRISTEQCQELCRRLQQAVAELDHDPIGAPIKVEVQAAEGHRFVLLVHGSPSSAGLSAAIADTDPQRLGVPPLKLQALAPEAQAIVAHLERALQAMLGVIAQEPQANRMLLRGFSQLPKLPTLGELYKMRCGAFAAYPLYRGVAAAVGMEVVPCGKSLGEIVTAVATEWERFDFFFLHVKQTDLAGEDGDLAMKVRVLEEVDEALPKLLNLAPDVLAITADHSTPAPMKGHSWHPVPLLLHSQYCFVDECRSFTELAALHGSLGTFNSQELMALLLGHAGKLAKYGA